MRMGLSAKPWRGGNRFQTTTLVKLKEALYWLKSSLAVATGQLSHIVLAQGSGSYSGGWCEHSCVLIAMW